MDRYTPISIEVQQEIIRVFRTEKDNRISQMAITFGVTAYRINKIIDDYLKSKC